MHLRAKIAPPPGAKPGGLDVGDESRHKPEHSRFMQSILVCPRFAVLQTRSNHCVTQWCVVVCSGVFPTLTGKRHKKKKYGRTEDKSVQCHIIY